MPDLSGVPASLRAVSRWITLAGVPAMVSHPAWSSGSSAQTTVPSRPWLLWMHGRSVQKEIDPGRFLRCVRSGIACVAVDLPGHGERFEAGMQEPHRTLEVIDRMEREIDAVVDAVLELGGFDVERFAIGGMSAGGMATLARLSRPHRFTAAVVECTTGSWRWQPNILKGDPAVVARLDPIRHLDGWRPIPFLALHNQFDEWVPLEGQREFVDAVTARCRGLGSSAPIDLHVYDRTGAPNEHAGFGRMGADAKDRVVSFLSSALRA